jgi:hypothetical protein
MACDRRVEADLADSDAPLTALRPVAMPRVVILFGFWIQNRIVVAREPDVPGERPRRLSPVVPRGRDVSPRGLLALCQIPKHKSDRGAVALALGCERGVRVRLVSFHAPVTGHPAISRGQGACEERYEWRGLGPPHDGAGPRSSRGSPRAPPQPDLTEPHCAVPRVELTADLRAAPTRARRDRESRAGSSASCLASTSNATRRTCLGPGLAMRLRRSRQDPGRHPEPSRAIGGSVFSSRSWRAESCPGSQASSTH